MRAVCAGIKRDGGRCTQTVGPGESFCYGHDPARQDARRRAASRAGRSRPSSELQELKRDVRGVITAVLSETLKTGPASVSIQAYNTLLRACEVERRTHDMSTLLERLERLEERADRIRGA